MLVFIILSSLNLLSVIMDVVENNISRLLEGLASEENAELCDFTLTDQNEATVARGVTPSTTADYVPITKNTVTYIVMAVLFNSDNEVLMMQEAKKSCAGQWYLPAGRIEPGEDLEEGVKREVLEETGLHMEPTTLVMVECASKAWFRFIMTGKVTSGKLKTPADADSESLQAKWIGDVNELSLRANDIIPIIERALQYHLLKEPQHPYLLPAIRPHKKLLLRLVICIRSKQSNRVHILLSEKTEVHLPLCEINHNRNLHSTLRKFMVEIFGADVPSHKPHGVLCVEHHGKPEASNDGFCLTVIVAFRVPLEEVFPIDKYTWLQVNQDLGDKILARLPRWMTVPLNVIR